MANSLEVLPVYWQMLEFEKNYANNVSNGNRLAVMPRQPSRVSFLGRALVELLYQIFSVEIIAGFSSKKSVGILSKEPNKNPNRRSLIDGFFPTL